MKLDLLKKNWLDIVFEGKNKEYGAYELRKENGITVGKSLIIGSVFFGVALLTPLILDNLDLGTEKVVTEKVKVTRVKLPPKAIIPPPDAPPPPPPPPKVDVVKFVKPVVAKKEEVTEEVKEVKDLKDKQAGVKDQDGNKDADTNLKDPGPGPVDAPPPADDPDKLFGSGGVEVKPEFPGGMDKFLKFVGNTYQVPDEEGLKGKVFVSFVVEKDGTLTDIKVLRDIGSGTGAEAIRVLKKSPRWTPAEQNGKKVRCSYQLPISIESPE